MIKFIELYEKNYNNYEMREIFVNPAHIVAIREDVNAQTALRENRMPQGLTKDVSFSRVYLNTGNSNLSVLVAGSPDMLEQKLSSGKKLLKG